MNTIRLTTGQACAILHRLEVADCIRNVFDDTDHLYHLADPVEACARELASMLLVRPLFPRLEVDPDDEVTREVLREAIEGSTWIAVALSESPQAAGIAARQLREAARKLEIGLGLPAHEIIIPDER